jgi:hypothetical protein
MRKQALLVTIVMSLLLVGCVGSGTLPLPNPPIGPGPTDPDEVFDGSPTHLSLEFERSVPKISALSQNQESDEPEVAYVKITRTDHEDPYLGDVIYNVLRKVELEPGANTFSVDSELPAGRGYVTRSIVIQGDTFLEISSQYVLDAPANAITSERVPMENPQYSLQIPAQMYSGGGLSQIVARVPNHLSGLAFVYVWMGFNPWTENGGLRPTNSDDQSWIIGHQSGFLPEVIEPTKLYYQVGVAPIGDLFPSREIPWPFHYDPNLEEGKELPYIWVYPYPGWEE